MSTTIYLTRHGQTEWNLTHTLMGHHDSALTKQGQEEAAFLANSFVDKNIAAVISSDLGRASSTASAISARLNTPTITCAGFRERTFGSKYEAKPLTFFLSSLQGEIATQESSRDDIRFSSKLDGNIESDLEIFDRFHQALVAEVQNYPNKNILLISHEGAIRAFLIGLKLRTYDNFPLGSMEYCSFVKIDYDRGVFLG